MSLRARPRSAAVAPARQAISAAAAVSRPADMTVGPKTPNARATLIAARRMVACPKQRAAFTGSPLIRLGPKATRNRPTRATASEQYRRFSSEPGCLDGRSPADVPTPYSGDRVSAHRRLGTAEPFLRDLGLIA